MRAFDIGIYLVFGPLLVWNLYHWIREIRFYRRNRWNWDLDSGAHCGAPKMYYGSEGYTGDEMSARARVLWGYPFFIVICIVFISAAVLQVPIKE